MRASTEKLMAVERHSLHRGQFKGGNFGTAVTQHFSVDCGVQSAFGRKICLLSIHEHYFSYLGILRQAYEPLRTCGLVHDQELDLLPKPVLVELALLGGGSLSIEAFAIFALISSMGIFMNFLNS